VNMLASVESDEAYRQGNRLSSEPTFEVESAVLERILQPDEVLAAEALDYDIQEANQTPDTDPEILKLLRFQRSMVDMEPGEATLAARAFARETGKYATVAHTFGQRAPTLNYPLIHAAIVVDKANEQRWRILGVDMPRDSDDARLNSYRSGVERAWKDARNARQALLDAQAAEAQAMERITHLPISILGDE
jgi:hypothetical protein